MRLCNILFNIVLLIFVSTEGMVGINFPLCLILLIAGYRLGTIFIMFFIYLKIDNVEKYFKLYLRATCFVFVLYLRFVGYESYTY